MVKRFLRSESVTLATFPCFVGSNTAVAVAVAVVDKEATITFANKTLF